MSYVTGFEATAEDLQAAMADAGHAVDMDEADALFARHVRPRLEEVGKAAMSGGGDLDEQSDAARARIAEILREEGVIPSSPAP